MIPSQLLGRLPQQNKLPPDADPAPGSLHVVDRQPVSMKTLAHRLGRSGLGQRRRTRQTMKRVSPLPTPLAVRGGLTHKAAPGRFPTNNSC